MAFYRLRKTVPNYDAAHNEEADESDDLNDTGKQEYRKDFAQVQEEYDLRSPFHPVNVRKRASDFKGLLVV